MDYSTENWLGPFMKRIYRNMTNIHDKKLAKHDLTTSQVGVLSQLWNEDGQTHTELVEKLGIRAASLTGIVDVLIRKEWVVKKQDKKDARIKRLYVTEAGKALEEVSLAAAMEMEAQLTEGFSKEELAMLRMWLKRLYQNVDK